MITQSFKALRWLLISTAALALAAGAGTAQNAIQPCPVGGYAAVACPIVTDDVIRLNVISRLAGQVCVAGSPITVQVCNGVVTLVGPVADQSRRELATLLAQSVRGVVEVRNMLVLAGPTATDVQLVGLVRNTLSRLPFDSTQVKVYVTEGVVELRGSLKSELARTVLGQQAEWVPGVKAVHNNLIVDEMTDSTAF